MLEHKGRCFVFDTGPDFRQQMLRHEVKDIDAILLTHKHKDHLAGLDDVRPFNFRHQKDMPIYTDAHTIDHLHMEFYYIFEPNPYPGIPKLILHEIDETPFSIGDTHFTPIRVLHHKLTVWGFRVENFAYVTDASYIPPSSMERLKGLDVLVLNALRHKPHISHFSLTEAIEIVEKLKPKQAYFVHMSHDMGKHADVMASLPPNIELAYDGLVVESGN